MKATLDKSNWKILLDNEAIKAIRFCYGMPIDLRYKLQNYNKNMLYDWIELNKVHLFGHEILDISVSATDDNWHKYEHMIWDVVRQVRGC